MDYDSFVYGSAMKPSMPLPDSVHNTDILVIIGSFGTSPLDRLQYEESVCDLSVTTITPPLPFYAPYGHTCPLYDEERKTFHLSATLHDIIVDDHRNVPNVVAFHFGVEIGNCI
jgi:hypothetical protein